MTIKTKFANALIFIATVAFSHSAVADLITPLNSDWHLVAHVSNTGGAFDGNSQLASNYSYGTFTNTPAADTADFYREFPVNAYEILFITGDLEVWAVANYTDLIASINAFSGSQSPNFTFDQVGEFNGTDTIIRDDVVGNVLSRNNNVEDPWISYEGSHSHGVNNSKIIWGENNWGSTHTAHHTLKTNHGGLNVYIRATHVPEPSSVIMLLSGMLMLVRFRKGYKA
jgi:hypothetical protein